MKDNKKKYQFRQEVISGLNNQYRTNQFSQAKRFQDLVAICENALTQSIWKVAYEIPSAYIQKYSIKFGQLQNPPFTKEERQFLLEIAEESEKAIYKPSYAVINVFNGYVKAGKLNDIQLTAQYLPFGINFRYINLKQAMVYTALSQCQVWYTIVRERKKSKKQFDLDPLIEYFLKFVQRQNLENPFHINILPKKQIRNIQKKSNKQKNENQLYEAVSNGDYDLVKQLLHKGAKIQLPSFLNNRKNTQVKVTHRACLNKDIKMCKILDSFNANWQGEDSEKVSPIFYAIQVGCLETVKYLVQEIKVNIQKEDIQKRTPFYWACTQGDLSIIQYLYKAGCNINHKSQLGRTALSKSCYLGRKDIVLFLLSCKEIDINSKCKKGRTALHNAVFGPKGGRQGHKFGTNQKDSPECAQILLENGMDVDILDFQDCTPLHVATSSQAIDSIRLLLAYGASLTAKNNYEQVPLMTAAKFGHLETCRILYEEYGCDILCLDKFNKNILLLTAKFQHFDGQQIVQSNPVFFYFAQPFFKKCVQENRIDEIHRTFLEMISSLFIDKLHKQITTLWNLFKKYEVQHPKFTISHIQKILEIGLVHEKDKSKKKGAKLHIQQQIQQPQQTILAVQILSQLNLQPETLKQIYLWLIKKNQPKILQFVHYHELLALQKIQLLPQQMFSILESDSLQLKEKVVSFCLLSLNFDWISYRHETHTNIIQMLVRKQRSGCLVQVFKALSGKIPKQILTNKYLNQLKPQKGQKILQDLLWQKNESGLDAYQLSLVLKNKSLSKLVEEKIKQLHLEITSSLDIGQYIAIPQTNPQKLKQFAEKPHEQEELVEGFEKHINSMTDKDLQEWISFWRKMQTIIRKGIKQNYQKDEGQSFWKQSEKRQLRYLENQNQLDKLAMLYNQSLIGIDLQYFNHQGITIVSTLQISSVTQDFIVDCLSCPIQSISKFLRPILHSPKILKIMHGADNDLILIKSTFNLSLVNFADTSRLDLQLRNSHHDLRGLSTLCKDYLGVSMSKQYQVSEWRIRPIPHAMLEYARKDALILPHLLVQMLSKVEKPEVIRQFVLGGCKQVRRNKKASQPLLKQIKKN